jgi:hypothetical protein
MEKDFKELLRLLEIKSFNELLIFENGRLKCTNDLYVFKYKMRNFCELVYNSASSLINKFRLDQIVSAFKNLTMELVNRLEDRKALLNYVSRYK